MDIPLSYLPYTFRRNNFTKCFVKTTSPENLLHQHSHSRSHISTKRTLTFNPENPSGHSPSPAMVKTTGPPQALSFFFD
jgi:hypothetical protein